MIGRVRISHPPLTRHRLERLDYMVDLTGEYVVIRTKEAGAWTGVLKSVDLINATVDLAEARRLWHWAGAASLSGIAVHGVSKPKECKFPSVVPICTLVGVIEILEASEKCRKSIESVPEWRE